MIILQVNASFLTFAVPDKHNAKEFLNDGYAHDPCNVYTVWDEDGGCVANNFGEDMTKCNGDFIYSKDIYPETLSTRFVNYPQQLNSCEYHF